MLNPGIRIFLFIALSIIVRNTLADETRPCQKTLIPVISLDIELLGDTTVESMKKQDEFLLNKYSTELRLRLTEKRVFTIIDDKESLTVINKAAENQFLHRCNGCELSLAKQLGAKQVVVPWVFRMSKLVQTMFVELRDVETGVLLMRQSLDFRGNTEDGWDHVTNRMVEEIKSYVSKCH